MTGGAGGGWDHVEDTKKTNKQPYYKEGGSDIITIDFQDDPMYICSETETKDRFEMSSHPYSRNLWNNVFLMTEQVSDQGCDLLAYRQKQTLWKHL
jgi:hypothetical protein